MLPIILPQSGELLKFDKSLNNMELLPEEATIPDAGFSDLLKLTLDELPNIELVAGEALPEAGNPLPQSHDVSIDTDAGDVAVTDVIIEGLLPAAEAVSPDVSAVADAAPSDQRGPGSTVLFDGEQLAREELPANVLMPAPQVKAVRTPRRTGDALPTPVADLNRQPRAATSVHAEMAVADVAHDDVAESQPALLRPVVDRPAERRGRTSHNVSVESAHRDVYRSIAADQPAPPGTMSADGPMPRPLELARDDAGVRIPAVQQAATTATQPVIAPSSAPQISAQPLIADAAASTLPPSTALIDTPVSDSAWGERLGERVVFMAGNQLRSAEIRLTPAELGPLRVQVSVDDGAANVTFHAQHAVTREAIEQAMPRLREMLAENGLTLGQASVADQGVANQGHANRDDVSDQAGAAADAGENDAVMADEPQHESIRVRVPDGLVDTFA